MVRLIHVTVKFSILRYTGTGSYNRHVKTTILGALRFLYLQGKANPLKADETPVSGGLRIPVQKLHRKYRQASVGYHCHNAKEQKHTLPVQHKTDDILEGVSPSFAFRSMNFVLTTSQYLRSHEVAGVDTGLKVSSHLLLFAGY
jgi:hypothetical protein